MLEGIGRVFTLRIKNSDCGRHSLIRHVVITYNEIDATFLGISYFVDCLDATIEHNNKFYVPFCCLVYSFPAYSITLVVTVGNVVFDVGIELLQELVNQSYRRTSIYVVVTIDHDAFLASHSVVQTVNSHVHVVHEEWIDELVEHRTEESLSRRFRFDATLYKQVSKYRTHADLVCQLLSRLFSFGCRWFVIPFEIHLYCFLFSCRFGVEGLSAHFLSYEKCLIWQISAQRYEK